MRYINGGVVVNEAPEDGATAVSFLPTGYSGPCVLKYDGRNVTNWALFPSAEEGLAAACLANRYDVGGFQDVELHTPEVAPDGTPGYATAEQWLSI
ncbi:hypothetical protein [Xanthomonas arboricola]|uniref:hypothetical protein n=1 Tax=Xanthomonas arboricola TaxID=56448 RepID=UPI00118734EA|nr:hypothetical protein [Xanthomonas arboricola]